MPQDQQVHEKWSQLVRDWRSVWDPWNEVMDRITLAFSQFENPSHEDIGLEDQLRKQVDAAEMRMQEFRRTILLSSSPSRPSP